MFVLFGFLYYLSSFLEDKHGIRGIWKGLLLAVPLFSVCLSSFVTGKVIGDHKKRMKWVSVTGLIILTLPMLYQGFANPENLYAIMALMFISGTGIGITLPCLDALITNGIEKKQRGTITSLYSSMRFVGVAAGPPATSLLMDNETVLFYLLAALSAVLCFLALLAIKPDRAA